MAVLANHGDHRPNATAVRQAARIRREVAGTRRVQALSADLDAAWRAFQRRLPGLDLPLSAVQVPGPLPVPGCTLMADLWVYAP